MIKTFGQLVFGIIATLLLTSCMGTYLISSSYNQLKLMSQRTPLGEVLEDPKTPEEVKRKLRLAQEARVFAENTLSLKPTHNYTSYVTLDRPYVTYIVRVAHPYELKPRTWWFPIVGDVPYKGYFNKEDALEEAEDFKKGNFDTYVRGATAYSTLGWFDDPILSSMMSYSDHQLVNLIIHETVHATLYIKGNADFNERLATFIGNVGTEIFYKNKEGEQSQTLKRIGQENEDSKRFSTFITKELEDLKKWYKDNAGKIDKDTKTKRLSEIQDRFKSSTLPKMQVFKYDSFIKTELNNARLLSMSTYQKDLSQFEKLYKKLGMDFKKLIDYCKSLEDSKSPEKDLKNFVL